MRAIAVIVLLIALIPIYTAPPATDHARNVTEAVNCLTAVLNEGRPQPEEIERILGAKMEHKEQQSMVYKYDDYHFRNTAKPVLTRNSNYSLLFRYKGGRLVGCASFLFHRSQRGMPFDRVKQVYLDALQENFGGVLKLREKKHRDNGFNGIDEWEYDFYIPLRGGRVQKAVLSIQKNRGAKFLSWAPWSLVQHNQFQRLWLRCDEDVMVSIHVYWTMREVF